VIGKQPRVEEHSIDGDALLSLVAAGRGISLHCEGSIQIAHPDLAALEIHDATGPTWMIYSACWRKDHANPALTSFLALLRAHRSMLSVGRIPDT
jgi:DNA-binding transcriptional LysR family regulator